MVNEIFDEQQKLINYFFDNLEINQVEKFVDTLLDINQKSGVIYFTGMGKSGIISKNISQLLVSIGIRSMFLSPVDALHGDVGVLRENDLLILFSRSGQTNELINLLPAVRNKNTQTFAVISNINGILAQECDQYIHLPIIKELCPFNMAPTTSSAIQLIFGNTIVAILMNKIGLTKDEYAKNHPAGRIGKRLTVSVSDIMKTRDTLAICYDYDLLIEQIDKMSASKCGCLLIQNHNYQLIGIFTDGDLRRAIGKYGSKGLHLPIKELMTKNPKTTTKDKKAFDVMLEMEKDKSIKEMPVIDDKNHILGLIMLHDLVKFGL